MPKGLTVCLLMAALLLPAGPALGDVVGQQDAGEGGGLVAPGGQAAESSARQDMSVWFWVAALLVVSFVLGVLAVMAGVGGAVLYVPLVSGFMPFHLDYVRAAGLLMAMAGSLAAGPGLLRRGLASLHLTMPLALVASLSSIAGAVIGLRLPTAVVETTMGLTIILIAVIMGLSRRAEHPALRQADAVGRALGLWGAYCEETTGEIVHWRTSRHLPAVALFVVIGLLAGMFGVGAGWANVPVLNLLMGAPLKLSVATSNFMIGVTDTTAAWVYINSGAALPLVVVPSVVGIMLGARLGVKLLARFRPRGVRYMVLTLLVIAGSRALLKGTGIWN